MNLSFVLKSPVITEKSLNLAKQGIFTFFVDPKATKDQIAQAIEQFYSVNVVNVRTASKPGKKYRVGRTRIIKTKSPAKKALVQLKSGQTIDLFDIEEPKS